MDKDFNSTLKDIKTWGFWRIHCYPSSNGKNLMETPAKCQEVLRNASVSFTGWDYPHVPTANNERQEIYIAGDKVEAWVNSGIHKEILRFYQDGQFIHLLAVNEDWFKEDEWIKNNSRLGGIEPGSVLDVSGVVYLFTEIYQFLNNLILSNIYPEGVSIELSLHNTKGRKLIILTPGKIPLSQDYKSYLPIIQLPPKSYAGVELRRNSSDVALESIVWLFNQFQWVNPSIDTLKGDQKKLLERKL